MMIRIVTSHPSLQHVLRRTAPLGVTLSSHPGRRSPHYAIELSIALPEEKKLTPLLVHWLPPHLGDYGAEKIEISGKISRREEADLRRSLAPARSRRIALAA